MMRSAVNLADAGHAAADGFEGLLLGSGQTILHRRKLFKMAGERKLEVWQFTDSREYVHNRSRIAGAKSCPRVARREPLCGRDFGAGREESGKARRWLDTQIVVGRHRGDARTAVQRQAVEYLQEVQLVVEIVLEPQDDLVDWGRACRSEQGPVQRPIAVGQRAANRFGRPPTA